MNTKDLAYLKKKIIYRSTKRGCRESEIILDKFIKNLSKNTSTNTLLDLDFLLSYDDNKILDWFQNKKTPPLELQNLVENIRQTISNE